MEERCIFKYRRSGEWIFPLYNVKVLECQDGGMILYDERVYGKEQNDSGKIEISLAEIVTIKDAMMTHPQIFSYKKIENPLTFGGISSEFLFAPEDGVSVKFQADNISVVKEPGMEQYFQKDADHPDSRYPSKAVEVVKVFDAIAKVLIEAGVEEEYLRI